MLNKGQLFNDIKDAMVIVLIICVIITSICIIDIYSTLNLHEACIDTLQDCADKFFDYMNNTLWIQI